MFAVEYRRKRGGSRQQTRHKLADQWVLTSFPRAPPKVARGTASDVWDWPVFVRSHSGAAKGVSKGSYSCPACSVEYCKQADAKNRWPIEKRASETPGRAWGCGGGGVASEKVGSAEVELRVKINFIRGWAYGLAVLPPLPPSSTSSTMLTTRGVHRLSRKALQSAKRTNAFFSSAAAAPILARAASAPSSSRAQARPARAVPQQGLSFSCHAIALY